MSFELWVGSNPWFDPGQDDLVTFQIAMVGHDGLVVGSDSVGVHSEMLPDGTNAISQTVHQRKFFQSESGSIICCAAGGAMSPVFAQALVKQHDPARVPGASLDRWVAAVEELAKGMAMPYFYPVDRLLVVRRDIPDTFWVVTRRRLDQHSQFASVMPIHEHFCIGNSLAAQFLPQHLWKRTHAIADLKRLAELTLSYAAEEDPTHVGPPFDIMTLGCDGQVSWSVQNVLTHQSFQIGLEELL